MFTNSGRFTARLPAVLFGIRTGGVSFPSSSTCVRNICVYGVFVLDVNTIHRPSGENECHEFMRSVLQRISRASPPSRGTIHSRPSGRSSCPFRHFVYTSHRPSGDTFGKVLLIPFADAPSDRHGLAAPAVVERDAVEVVPDLGLVLSFGCVARGRPAG